MRPWILRGALSVGAASLLVSCAREAPTAPEALSLVRPFQALVVGAGPAVRISEIHYDSPGTDVNERVEVSGPAGKDLAGWTLVLYNGAAASRAPYATIAIDSVIAATCDQRGVVVLSTPGLQNGAPDGIAIVNDTGVVEEFLSYEGSFVAASGAAAGMTSTDIGVSESGGQAAGTSLQRQPDGTWAGSAAHSFGACNDGTENGTPTEVAASLAIVPETASVLVGDTTRLVATARDANGTIIPALFSWFSLDSGVAVPDSNGVVTGVAAGEARIVAVTQAVADTALVVVTEPPPPPTGVVISEIHYDNVGADLNEAIEVEGPAGTDLTGWTLHLYNGSGGVIYGSPLALTGTIADQCDGRGTAWVAAPGLQNGAPDGLALVNDAGTVVEFLSYEGTFTATNGPAAGMASVDIGAAQGGDPVGTSLHRTPAGTWASAAANFGYCYGVTPPPPPNAITFSGRDAGDPALPVGFEDQFFATLRSGVDASVIPTHWTWSSETPLLASVDSNGVVRALDAGTAVLRATAGDGTTATVSLATTIATASATAAYGNHTEFGDPTDGDASDEIILRRAQYTTSFSPARGIPNWVSYNLEGSHFGGQDRCDCFTYDPELPEAQRYTTADYTGAGAAAGYGIDRGHLVRSFDRTSGSLDNATTFYFSNIIPQAADNNQGPWAAFESYLGDLARFSDKEVFIVAGATGSKGTVKDAGRITIPAATWKVAVVLPRDAGLASIDSWDDLEVLAVLMPNDAGIRNVGWQTYLTTVDSLEAASGYDLLSALRDDIETAVESNTQPPVARLDGPWSAYAGDLLAMSGDSSSDADGDMLTFAWDLGDGASASGATITHTFTQPGEYTVRLVVTDVRGLADTVSSTATITLLPPAVGIARARSGVAALADAGALDAGEQKSLLAKLDAADRSLVRGNTTAARQQLEAFRNELDALVRSGRLTPEQVAMMREVIGRVVAQL